MSRRGAAAFVLAVAATPVYAQPAPQVDRETSAFVVTYRCDRGDAIAVGYPAYRDARNQPIRLAWRGKTYVMHAARSGSGARYVTSNNRLEWWSRGDGGFLAVPNVDPKVLDNCTPF